MLLVIVLAFIGLFSIVKFVYCKYRHWFITDDELKTAKAEAEALRKWFKAELAKLNALINKEAKPELRKMDAGVVAANPALQEADDETLAAYGIYRRADGFYMEHKPIDPRDAVLAMSDEEAKEAYWAIIVANGVFQLPPEYEDEDD